jgi:hypothetical protein
MRHTTTRSTSLFTLTLSLFGPDGVSGCAVGSVSGDLVSGDLVSDDLVSGDLASGDFVSGLVSGDLVFGVASPDSGTIFS